jgi:carbamoylphosphate synthase large subunit
MPDQTFNLLMTCVGGGLSAQAILLAKQSKTHNIKIIGVDADENALGRTFADQFYTVPRVDDPAYLEVILKIIAEEDIHLVLPCSDEEALFLAKNRGEIETSERILACAPYETLEILSNKAKTYNILKSVPGLHCPLWQEVLSEQEIRLNAKNIYDACGAVVIKPSITRGGRDVLVISREIVGTSFVPGAREVRMDMPSFNAFNLNIYKDKYPVIVMQGLKEPVHDIDILSMHGKALNVIPRKRVNSAVPNAGHMLVDDARLIDIGHKIVNAFHLSWLQDIDVMFDHENRPCVIEVNPRPSGSFAVAVAAGVPLLDNLVSLAKHQPLQTYTMPCNERVITYTALKKVAL